MHQHSYHNELSTYEFRRNLGRGRDGNSYFTISDADDVIRALHSAAVALAHENGVGVPDDDLAPMGWGAPSTDELRTNINATRAVMDALREAGIDYQATLTGRFSLAGYLLDSPSWHCTILDDAKVVRCRWRENWSV